ncbi:MAG: hypothetical protein HYY30_01950 [Chloroflexi bacterium]|nr:hypothetical protein [Chloroflexota bacterium]
MVGQDHAPRLFGGCLRTTWLPLWRTGRWPSWCKARSSSTAVTLGSLGLTVLTGLFLTPVVRARLPEGLQVIWTK